MKKKLPFLLALLAFVSLGTVAGGFTHANEFATVADAETRSIDDYYSSISPNLRGNDLLTALTNLNIGGGGVIAKRKKTVGYKNMWDYYDETDPGTVSDKYSAFYSGVNLSKGDMNKEHVWPDSRGGNLVEGDIHMPRPTMSSDNSSRGNSFYVEGKSSPSSGWDPKFAKNSDLTYRGESARIIFYCTTASRDLSLIDSENDSASNKTMGKLSDLIKWHLEYNITNREKIRNNAAEKIQGNRNAFIDHPEYVCRIWGNYNDATRALCAKDPYGAPAPTSITLSDVSITMRIGETKTVSVTGVTPTGANTAVTWSSSNTSVAEIDYNGKITAKGTGSATITATSSVDTSIKKTISLTVTTPDPVGLSDINVSIAKSTIFTKDTTQVTCGFVPQNVYPVPQVTYSSNNTQVATVNSNGLVTGVGEGFAVITVVASQGTTNVSKTVQVTVNKKEVPDFELITTSTTLVEGDKVVLATGLTDTDKGVTGWNGTKDANISNIKSAWKNYVVKSSTSSSNYKLYDESVGSYIASPTSNQFIYGTVGGDFKKDDGGYAICNSRYLCANTTYIRFYTSIGQYTAFKAYKLNTEIGPGPDPVPVTLTGIVVSVQPTKTEYYVNDEFDPTGLKITALYSDGSLEIVTNYTLSTPDMTRVGQQSVQVTYDEFTTSFNITILSSQEVTLTGLKLENVKTEYHINDDFVKPTVKACYSDESEIDVTDAAYCLGYDKTKLGKQTVTVYYLTLTETYDIEVYEGTEAQIVRIKITQLPTKIVYYQNEIFDPSGMIIYGFYEDESGVNITSDCEITTTSMAVVGPATVTARYKGFTDNFDISVLEITAHVESVKLNTNNLTLGIGKGFQFTVTFNPSDCTNKNVTWNSSNNTCLLITDTGLCIGLAEGEATVSVTSLDGNKTDYCTVKVTKEEPLVVAGCGGNIETTSILLSVIALLGAGCVTIILTKKRKENRN